jgi:hypothetical protein
LFIRPLTTYNLQPTMTSVDGYQWTERDGLKKGVPTIGLIQPTTNLVASTETEVYDVAIIGAGYTALTAARDSTLNGQDLLYKTSRVQN